MTTQRDPDYDFVPPLPKPEDRTWPQRKGSQCGECGMKFEYARIIDPDAFNPLLLLRDQDRQTALEKADAIIALRSGGRE
jgi:hypothetical protein